jgi:hypothetical protein
MNCCESFLIHILQKQTLIDEQRVNDLKPLYQLTPDIAFHN